VFDSFYFMPCRWILLEVVDNIFPRSVNWKHATRPPIRMPFRKVENCNQVIKIGKQLRFSLVNLAGNDIVQENKKLILGNVFISLYLPHKCYGYNLLFFLRQL